MSALTSRQNDKAVIQCRSSYATGTLLRSVDGTFVLLRVFPVRPGIPISLISKFIFPTDVDGRACGQVFAFFAAVRGADVASGWAFRLREDIDGGEYVFARAIRVFRFVGRAGSGGVVILILGRRVKLCWFL